MEPFDLIWWAIAFMIACIPTGIGIIIIGIAIAEVHKKFRKG